MDREVSGSADPPAEATVRVALPSDAVPSALIKIAVMVVVPDPTVVANPVVKLIDATVGELECH
jgi:hypothetical protein